MARVFISYAHADEGLRQELDKHLMSLKHQGLIEAWHDRRIGAGQEWKSEIDQNLTSADIVLLLISSDFIASEYCYDLEMREAIRRHDKGSAIVIPVILRSCHWQELPFGKLLAATKDGRPVTKFPSLDDGFLEVIQSIHAAATRSSRTSGATPVAAAAPEPAQGTLMAPRTGNLRVKKQFSDLERDQFLADAFEYVAAFFENSLSELESRNPQLKSNFRRRDANGFEAAIYDNGKRASVCGIWVSSKGHAGDIGYNSSGLGNGSSWNESLSIADDGYALGLKPMGMGHFLDGGNKVLTPEGASEYLWAMFIRQLQ